MVFRGFPANPVRGTVRSLKSEFGLDVAVGCGEGLPSGIGFGRKPGEFVFRAGAVNVDDEFASGFLTDPQRDLGVGHAARAKHVDVKRAQSMAGALWEP